MEKNKGKVKLNDELLDKVAGGWDDYDICIQNPNGSGEHEWVMHVRDDGSMYYECKWCELRME